MNRTNLSFLLEKKIISTNCLKFSLVLVWAKNFNSKIIVYMLANETEVDFRSNKNNKTKKKKIGNLPSPGIVQNLCKFSGLNQGSLDIQSNALPTELRRKLR